MSDDPNAPAGWKTMADGSHVVITRAEADSILAEIDRRRAERAARLPDEKAAINAMFDAYDRLRELGWREAIYCPKDGSDFQVIEPGSTGIFRGHYHGEWPDGHWYSGEGFDYGPSHPILFKLYPEDQAIYDAKMAEARERFRQMGGVEGLRERCAPLSPTGDVTGVTAAPAPEPPASETET